jgi:hypothetical protein
MPVWEKSSGWLRLQLEPLAAPAAHLIYGGGYAILVEVVPAPVGCLEALYIMLFVEW